jgi:manganese/zinc/iron transport system permease protein
MDTGTVILLTGILCAVACALLGSFLVLRKMAMMADAISHAILPGLVVAYFLAQGPNLLAGFVGAAAAAVVTVSLVELLQNTRRVGSESAIGLVFPALFALGTVLVSRFFANVHLDTDAVLYGNIEFAPFDTLQIGDRDLGPQSLWIMGTLCLINLLFVGLLYKELKLATFDAGLSAALGFSPVVIHYLLMTMVSITAVGAFTAVGAVLVVALIIVPAAAAYLLTDRLPVMIGLSALIGGLSAVLGYLVAIATDVSIAGAMASAAGLLFGLALLFAPSQGLVARWRRLRKQRRLFAIQTLLVHLATHERTSAEARESAIGHLSEELRWAPAAAQQVIGGALRAGLVEQVGERLRLTEQGRSEARAV